MHPHWMVKVTWNSSSVSTHSHWLQCQMLKIGICHSPSTTSFLPVQNLWEFFTKLQNRPRLDVAFRPSDQNILIRRFDKKWCGKFGLPTPLHCHILYMATPLWGPNMKPYIIGCIKVPWSQELPQLCLIVLWTWSPTIQDQFWTKINSKKFWKFGQSCGFAY